MAIKHYIGQCPWCGRDANLGYACGEYFIYCGDGCDAPACFHSSKEATLKEYNEIIDKAFGSVACEGECHLCHDFLCDYYLRG